MTQHLTVDVGGVSLRAIPLQPSPITAIVIDAAYRYADIRGIPRKLLLPPVVDVLTAIAYWKQANGEWHTCLDCGIKVWPFVACCPTCLLYNAKFTKVAARKPHPATISVASTEAILSALQECAHRANCTMTIMRASEPVDAILLLASDTPALAEMKTSPFITPPLIQIDDQPYVQLPFGTIHRLSVLGEITCHRDDVFLMQFFDDWLRLWPEYQNTATSDRVAPYYLTNGCGKPRGTGINISDDKTSVGLDRTDDIKKAFFTAANNKFCCKDSAHSIILSNLPPTKHDDHYSSEWFNLFDGVVSLGGPIGIRDPALAYFASFDWIESNASLLEAAQ